MLHRLVVVRNGSRTTALGLLALDLAQLEFLGGGFVGHGQERSANSHRPSAGGAFGRRRAIIAAVPESIDQETVQLLGIDHVQVAAPAGSEPQARRYYGEVLGLTEVAKPPALQARGGVWFACGVDQLHVGISDRFSPADKAHPALKVRLGDLERLAGRLEAAGATVRWDNAIPGTRRFYSYDPWGNRIEFVGAGG